jgi:threonylcarbamoyladenosine tRNA methylthiotransferase MtaB
VQDGCDNHCTFCVITIARGASRSRPLREIVAEVNALAAAGYKEAVLTGVHLGAYGRDRGEHEDLSTLVRAVLGGTPILRLRVSSLEPWDILPDFFWLWQDPRLCRHLHLPLQSGSGATLRRMARRTTPAAFARLAAAARAHIPDLALTTDIMVGFPGETEAEFEESLAFVQEMDFAKLHVFRYSPRPGTAAAMMPGQVDEATKRSRSARMQALSEQGARRFRERFVGRVLPVLWESVEGIDQEGWRNSGLTDNYLRVRIVAPCVLSNTITPARLTGVVDGSLAGELVREPAR